MDKTEHKTLNEIKVPDVRAFVFQKNRKNCTLKQFISWSFFQFFLTLFCLSMSLVTCKSTYVSFRKYTVYVCFHWFDTVILISIWRIFFTWTVLVSFSIFRFNQNHFSEWGSKGNRCEFIIILHLKASGLISTVLFQYFVMVVIETPQSHHLFPTMSFQQWAHNSAASRWQTFCQPNLMFKSCLLPKAWINAYAQKFKKTFWGMWRKSYQHYYRNFKSVVVHHIHGSQTMFILKRKRI